MERIRFANMVLPGGMLFTGRRSSSSWRCMDDSVIHWAGMILPDFDL